METSATARRCLAPGGSRLVRRAKPLDPSRLVTYVSNSRHEQKRAYALAAMRRLRQAEIERVAP